MKKKNIIKESRDYTKIINQKKKVSSKYYSIYYQKNNENINRYGISIPKKTGNAVVRNKIKRQLKNIIDHHEFTIQKPYDYVIIIRKNVLDINYQEKESELLNIMSKIGEKDESKK